VVVWLAAHPEMVFTADEIAHKFDIPRTMVRQTLNSVIKKRLIAQQVHPKNKGLRLYSAGPALLELI